MFGDQAVIYRAIVHDGEGRAAADDLEVEGAKFVTFSGYGGQVEQVNWCREDSYDVCNCTASGVGNDDLIVAGRKVEQLKANFSGYELRHRCVVT